MNVKISEMPQATSVGGSDIIPIVQSGVSKQATKRLLNSYSTTEQVVGTWIDGKPLYRIVKQITAPQISTDNQGANASIDLASLNIEYLSLEHATLKDTPNNSLYPLPVFRGQTLGVRLVFTPTTAYIWNYNTLYNNCVCTFSILYTKTTDSAS